LHHLSFNPQAVLDVAHYAADIGRIVCVAQLASAFDVYGRWALDVGGKPRDGSEQIRYGLVK